MKSSGGPTACQRSSGSSKTARARSRAPGRTIAAPATPPSAWPPTAKTVAAGHRLALEVARGLIGASRPALAAPLLLSRLVSHGSGEVGRIAKSIVGSALPTRRSKPPSRRSRRARGHSVAAAPADRRSRAPPWPARARRVPGRDRRRRGEPERRCLAPGARGRASPSWSWAARLDQVGELADARGRRARPAARARARRDSRRRAGRGRGRRRRPRRRGSAVVAAGSPRGPPRPRARTRRPRRRSRPRGRQAPSGVADPAGSASAWAT